MSSLGELLEQLIDDGRFAIHYPDVDIDTIKANGYEYDEVETSVEKNFLWESTICMTSALL